MPDRGEAQNPTLESLAEAASGGDRAAEERLYALARTKLLGMALALGVAGDDAPDLVQEILVAAWRNLHRFDAARGSFLAWLTPGLRGRIQNGFRASRRETAFLQRLLHFHASPARRENEPQAAIDARVTLERLIGALTARQRDVVALYELGGLDSEETARILGIGAAGVRSIARDARARLREASARMSRGRDEQPAAKKGEDDAGRSRRNRAAAAVGRRSGGELAEGNRPAGPSRNGS